MFKEQLKGNTMVTNIKYGNDEVVVFTDVLMKDSQKEWIPAVVYIGRDRNSEEFRAFCKEEQAFLNEFILKEEYEAN